MSINNSMFSLLISILTVVVSTTIAYFNYRLNRTLNIKNGLYNEKLKIYTSLTYKLAKLIFYLDKSESILSDHLTNGDTTENLAEIAKKIDNDVEEIDLLLIQSYLLAPKSILDSMQRLSERINFGYPQLHLQDPLENYIKEVNETRLQAENFINILREDLKIEKLNSTLKKSLL